MGGYVMEELLLTIKDEELRAAIEAAYNSWIARAYQDGWDDYLEVTARSVQRDFNIRIPIN